MKLNHIVRLAAPALIAGGLPGAADAQTVTDEVRCVMLSNGFIAASKDAPRRQVAAATGAYFLGRLDTRPPAQVKAAIAAERNAIAPAKAGPMMNACAARAGRAEAQLRALAGK